MRSHTNDFILKAMIFSQKHNWIQMFRPASDLADMKSTKNTIFTVMVASKHSLLMKKYMKYMVVLTHEETVFGKSLNTNNNSRRKLRKPIYSRYTPFFTTCSRINIYDGV